MAEEFFIPKLGQTVEEVTIIKWLAEDGAKVAQGQEIVEVQTDKTIFPVEASAAGVLHVGPYKAGDVVPVLTVVAVIGGPDDRFDLPPGQTAAMPEIVAAEPEPVEQTASAVTALAAPRVGARVFASPRARRLARERRIDLAGVTPTGGNGVRVRESDVVAYLEQAALVAAPSTMVPGTGLVQETLTMVADAAALVAMRVRIASEVGEAWGFVPDDLDWLLLAVGRALRRFPLHERAAVGQ